MKNKKAVAMMLFIVLAGAVFTGCGDKGRNERDFTISVGLVTDKGGINDKAFNQSANEGALLAKSELGISYTTIEVKNEGEYKANIQSLIDSGCDLTIAVGYQLADAVAGIASENPKSDFCVIDGVVEADNVQSIIFKEEEGSFLVGVIAGLMTKTNKIGFIGGKDEGTIPKFEAGFAAGVAAVNQEAAAGLISEDGKVPGSTVKYIDSFENVNKGYELARELYEADCDIIYHAAGAAGMGMFKAAKELKEQGKVVWGIGVDIDQGISSPEYAEVILTSMVKRAHKATYDAVKSKVNGKFKAETREMGIAEDGIGIADSSSLNIPEDVLIKVQEFKDKIKTEELRVPAKRGDVKNSKEE